MRSDLPLEGPNIDARSLDPREAWSALVKRQIHDVIAAVNCRTALKQCMRGGRTAVISQWCKHRIAGDGVRRQWLQRRANEVIAAVDHSRIDVLVGSGIALVLRNDVAVRKKNVVHEYGSLACTGQWVSIRMESASSIESDRAVGDPTGPSKGNGAVRATRIAGDRAVVNNASGITRRLPEDIHRRTERPLVIGDDRVAKHEGAMFQADSRRNPGRIVGDHRIGGSNASSRISTSRQAGPQPDVVADAREDVVAVDPAAKQGEPCRDDTATNECSGRRVSELVNAVQ